MLFALADDPEDYLPPSYLSVLLSPQLYGTTGQHRGLARRCICPILLTILFDLAIRFLLYTVASLLQKTATSPTLKVLYLKKIDQYNFANFRESPRR